MRKTSINAGSREEKESFENAVGSLSSNVSFFNFYQLKGTKLYEFL